MRIDTSDGWRESYKPSNKNQEILFINHLKDGISIFLHLLQYGTIERVKVFRISKDPLHLLRFINFNLSYTSRSLPTKSKK